jgi:predicted chitinase
MPSILDIFERLTGGKDTIVTEAATKGENPEEMSLRLFDEENAKFKAENVQQPSFQAQTDLVDPAFFAKDQVVPPITGAPERRPPSLTAAPTTAMVSRTLTPEESAAISDRGDEVGIARGYRITNQQGDFSDTDLSGAITNSMRSTTKQALLKGAIEVETGGAGPVTEDHTYSLKAAYKAWLDADVDTVFGTLPAEVRVRLQHDYDNSTPTASRRATGSDMQMLGEAMMEAKYMGGFNYRGRGLIQITGSANYRAVQKKLKAQGILVDLVANPELVNDNRYALPAALAFLSHAGLDDTAAEGVSAKSLNNFINSGAGREVAEDRWSNVISELRAAGKNDKANEMELRDEYAAQRRVGVTIDGAIGPNSKREMRTWLGNNTNITTAEASNLTPDELVVAVNSAP